MQILPSKFLPLQKAPPLTGFNNNLQKKNQNVIIENYGPPCEGSRTFFIESRKGDSNGFQNAKACIKVPPNYAYPTESTNGYDGQRWVIIKDNNNNNKYKPLNNTPYYRQDNKDYVDLFTTSSKPIEISSDGLRSCSSYQTSCNNPNRSGRGGNGDRDRCYGTNFTDWEYASGCPAGCKPDNNNSTYICKGSL